MIAPKDTEVNNEKTLLGFMNFFKNSSSPRFVFGEKSLASVKGWLKIKLL